MQRTSFLTALFLFSLSACAAKTLDGGSTGDTAGTATGSPSGSSTGAGAEIADAPLAGTIAGKPFEAKSIDVSFNERSGKWVLSIDNYEGNCGSIKNRPPSDESMTVNFVGFDPAAGTYVVEQPKRYATLQLGIYEASENKQPDTRNATTGTLVLDTWDETAGNTITGKMKLFADDESAVEGTFTATVCPPR
jgi:hypothetical protein